MSEAAHPSTAAGGPAYAVEPDALPPVTPGVLTRLRGDRFAVAGAIGIAVLVLVALLAPLSVKLTGHGPNESFISEGLDSFGVPRGPSKEFPFGVDVAGRDVFVRTVYGARTALLVGVTATAMATTIGVLIGLLCGFFGGVVDLVLSRVIDLFLVLPVFLLTLGLASACGGPTGCVAGIVRPGLSLVIFVIGLSTWGYMARVVRGQTLALRDREFVAAAQLAGAGELRILLREVLPSIVPTVIVLTVMLFPGIILYEAGLSFLGIGSIDVPSWGATLGDARKLFPTAWWLVVFPGLFLALTVLSVNLLGEGLGDVLDPKHETTTSGGRTS
jgi:peptide/nickel transport system permease protein